MRCHSCRRLSFLPICRECRRLYLQPDPAIRILPSGLKVLSFYRYEELEPFLLSKHYPHGWLIYRILAAEAFVALERTGTLYVIAVDDDASGGYSHTALLAQAMKRWGYRPIPGALRAKNPVSYAGQPKAFRMANPRRFRYRGPNSIEAVLVDDIITTGLTLLEAQSALISCGVEVAGAVVLADAAR